MKYSQEVLKLLEQGVSGELSNYWDWSFEFNEKFGDDEDFAEAWDNENPEMFDLLSNTKLIIFVETHDYLDTKGWVKTLTPYYEKAKKLVA
ncbi:hypothetical protein RyT2_11470 [Pseudolactococcus yaeyamensis]